MVRLAFLLKLIKIIRLVNKVFTLLLILHIPPSVSSAHLIAPKYSATAAHQSYGCVYTFLLLLCINRLLGKFQESNSAHILPLFKNEFSVCISERRKYKIFILNAISTH